MISEEGQKQLAGLIGKGGYRDTGHRVTKRYLVGKCPHCAVMSIHDHTEPVLAPKPIPEANRDRGGAIVS